MDEEKELQSIRDQILKPRGENKPLQDNRGFSRFIESTGEDIDKETKDDKNKIYILLQERMAKHPGIAAYVAGQMSKSLTLEEAQLTGKTALAVYETVTTIEAILGNSKKR